jgi:hypothetical protein
LIRHFLGRRRSPFLGSRRGGALNLDLHLWLCHLGHSHLRSGQVLDGVLLLLNAWLALFFLRQRASFFWKRRLADRLNWRA